MGLRAKAIGWVVLLALAGGTHAQDAARAPAAGVREMERAQLSAPSRAPDFSLVNECPVTITSLRLKPAEGDGAAGANLLDRPVPSGERRPLTGLRGSCKHVITIGFATKRSLQVVQDLCRQPELVVTGEWAARPPISAAVISRPDPPMTVPMQRPSTSDPVGSRPITLPPPQSTRPPAETGPTPAGTGGRTPVDGPINLPQPDKASTGSFQRPPASIDETVFCAIVEERLPPDECAALAAVSRGTGAYKTPERMERGESRSIVLAISREADSSAPAEAIADAAGREASFKPVVGRYIEATLLADPGLKVTPDAATPELQDLGASPAALWRWTITAEATGDHQLTLRTRVMKKQPDGSFIPRGAPFVGTRKINVYVEGGAALSDRMQAAGKTFEDATGTTNSFAKLVGALTALVIAVGGLWLAFRRFGKPKSGEEAGKG
jgi:hypothetical protein